MRPPLAATATPARTPLTRPGAFTLVELVAVIVVLGILAAAAAVQTSSISSTSRLQWAARQAARDITFTRERAMTTGTTHWVRFDTASQYYAVLAEQPSAPGFAGASTIIDPSTQSAFVVNLNRNDWNGITLATGGSFATINYTVGFNKLGRPLSTTGAGLSTATGPTFQAGTPGGVSSPSGVSDATSITIAPGTGRIVY